MAQNEAFILTGITNAASEGINRLIKLEARNAFGVPQPHQPTPPITLREHPTDGPTSQARQTLRPIMFTPARRLARPAHQPTRPSARVEITIPRSVSVVAVLPGGGPPGSVPVTRRDSPKIWPLRRAL